jgi:hypothetical protein
MPDTPAQGKSDAVEHRVVILGISYADPDQDRSKVRGARFARRGDIVRLDPGEAQRLRALGAVVGVDEPDPEPEVPLLPASESPYGGQPLVSQEEHAANAHARQA